MNENKICACPHGDAHEPAWNHDSTCPAKAKDNPQDLIVWPDGDQCLREDMDDYTWKSDDYEVVPFGSDRWQELIDASE